MPAANRPGLPDERLLEADQRIVGVTQHLNQARLRRGEREIQWLYYQYLALLAADIYLDRWFRDPKRLLGELDGTIESLNADLPKSDRLSRLDLDVSEAKAAAGLNKLAFWMATGSGKTLLMHAHLLMFQDFQRKHGRERDLNRTILLTPNDGLSKQHLTQFEAAGMAARPFDRNGIAGAWIDVLDVHKLHDKMGDKRVAVSSFEGNNLVLVDEGHRGASSGEQGQWMRRRNELCERGFSFEYSATFGQAVAKDPKLTNEYSRSILFDYSYRWFHGDGYGKDYRIFNLGGQPDDGTQSLYLTAALLSFFQQQWLYDANRGGALEPWGVERPLWAFVGSSVTKGASTKDVSDVVGILRFLAGYAGNRPASTAHIRELRERGLQTTGGLDILNGALRPLFEDSGMSDEEIFLQTLSTTFNAPGGGALRVERLRGSAGELALHLGANEPFGVINVGDPKGLLARSEAAGIDVAEREFADSIFHTVHRPESRIHLVVGARKFNEGWDTWRVSSMGLMNVGRSEGAQIIQMFGRGVRLKGRDMSLKRSSALPDAREAPEALPFLETLQVFGVKADYMTQFRDFLKREGVAEERTELFVPVKVRALPSNPPLSTIRLNRAVSGADSRAAFARRGPMPVLQPPSGASGPLPLSRLKVRLDWYPKIRTQSSTDAGAEVIERNEGYLTCRHVESLDLDQLFFDLRRFKTERGWHNLTVTRTAIRGLLLDSSWYRLFAPPSMFAFDRWSNVDQWQEIAASLLRKYAARYYRACKEAWEAGHLEYRPLADDDPNMLATGRGFRVEFPARSSADEPGNIENRLRRLIEAIDRGDLERWNDRQVRAIDLDQHLYWPLLSVQDDEIRVSPPALNDGEFSFVRDLQQFLKSRPEALRAARIHLVRNQSRGHGVAFLEANNFHPDFILWVLRDGIERIAFIDPKGLGRLEGLDDPKIRLHETIKRTEEGLGNPCVRLESFIVSVTPYNDLDERWYVDGGQKPSRAEFATRHVLFREDGPYIREMFRRLGVP